MPQKTPRKTARPQSPGRGRPKKPAAALRSVTLSIRVTPATDRALSSRARRLGLTKHGLAQRILDESLSTR